MSSVEVKKTLALINNLSQGSTETKTQCLYKIKTNIISNESNLKIFRQLCGFKHLCPLLKTNTNPKIINIVLSILANSAMNDDIRKELILEHNVLSDVSSLLYSLENSAIHCRIVRLVANVSCNADYAKYVMRFPFLTRIVSLLRYSTCTNTIITCIRAIKYMWLWDQYRVHNEILELDGITYCLNKIIELNDKPQLVSTHLSIILAMLNVNSRAFIGQMNFWHYEWIVNLLDAETSRDMTIPVLARLSTACNKTHFELAKTSLVNKIIPLISPLNGSKRTFNLIRILCTLCKENLIRQKIIQTPHGINTLLAYLDADNIGRSGGTTRDDDIGTTCEGPIRERDGDRDMDAVGEVVREETTDKPSADKVINLTNAIHYHILQCINFYQYDHEGLYRFLQQNLIAILIKRLAVEIDKYEFKHYGPVCDQTGSAQSSGCKQSSGNMSPYSPNYSTGNMSPSLSPSMSPNRSPNRNYAPTSPKSNDPMESDDDDDDKSVYSPLIEFSDEDNDDSISNNEEENDAERQTSSFMQITEDSQQDIEERLDFHIIRIMLHISYMKHPFEQLSHKATWCTLIDYLVKIQHDDCCRNVYKIILIICKNRIFLRALLTDSFILVVHKKLCRMKHGTNCVHCSNVFIYGQGIINEIANETNSHYGFEEIMYQYRRQDEPAAIGGCSTSAATVAGGSASRIESSGLQQQQQQTGGLVHFMIPYLLKEHPKLHQILFSDAILERILNEMDGVNQEEAIMCVQELFSAMHVTDARKSIRLCNGCDETRVTYEGDITFLLDDGNTIKANKDILITKCVYFETMLCGNFKETEQKSNIRLGNISSACLTHLIKLIYNYCTCLLPRNNIETYLELIIKCDEYLLHELNYKLINLLYESNSIITSSNVHFVYKWALDYNYYIQNCVHNYENIFNKSEYYANVKRIKFSDTRRESKDELDGKNVKELKRMSLTDGDGDVSMRDVSLNESGFGNAVNEGDVDMKADKCDDQTRNDGELGEPDTNARQCGDNNDESSLPISGETSGTTDVESDKQTEKCDRLIGNDGATSEEMDDSADNVGCAGKTTSKEIPQPNCSRNSAEELPEENKDGNFVKELDKQISEIDSNVKEENTNKQIELTPELVEPKACLVTNLIEEINKNKTIVNKNIATTSNVQYNVQQGNREIKNLLLNKNVPLRRTSSCNKRKYKQNSKYEDLNVFLVKLVFGFSNKSNNCKKSIDMVRNIIELSKVDVKGNPGVSKINSSNPQESDNDDDTIFEQLKYDVYDFIKHNLR